MSPIQYMPASQAMQYTGCGGLAELSERIRAAGGKGHRIKGLQGTYYDWVDVETVKAGTPTKLKRPSRRASAGKAGTGITRTDANMARADPADAQDHRPNETVKVPKSASRTSLSTSAGTRVPTDSSSDGDLLSRTVIGLPGIAPYPKNPRAEITELAALSKPELVEAACAALGVDKSLLPYRRKDIAAMLVQAKMDDWHERQLAQAQARAGKPRGALAAGHKTRDAGTTRRRSTKAAPVVTFSHGAR